jgi:hypothetical protein
VAPSLWSHYYPALLGSTGSWQGASLAWSLGSLGTAISLSWNVYFSKSEGGKPDEEFQGRFFGCKQDGSAYWRTILSGTHQTKA